MANSLFCMIINFSSLLILIRTFINLKWLQHNLDKISGLIQMQKTSNQNSFLVLVVHTQYSMLSTNVNHISDRINIQDKCTIFKVLNY